MFHLVGMGDNQFQKSVNINTKKAISESQPQNDPFTLVWALFNEHHSRTFATLFHKRLALSLRTKNVAMRTFTFFILV